MAAVLPLPQTFPAHIQNAAYQCRLSCHTWTFVDLSQASSNHPNIFTHIPNDQDILGNQNDRAVPALPMVPQAQQQTLTYTQIVERVFTANAMNNIINGTDQYGAANENNYVPIGVSLV